MSHQSNIGLFLQLQTDDIAVSTRRSGSTPAAKTTHILLVEDNPGDIDLASLAVQDLDRDIELHPVQNAVEAFSFLAKQGVYAGVPTPHVIVMDLNMPIMNGLRALQIIKDTAAWHQIPVVIFSSSYCAEDRAAAFSAGAIAFQTKPEQWREYVTLVRRLLACAGSGFKA